MNKTSRKVKWAIFALLAVSALAYVVGCGSGVEFGATTFVLKGAGS